MTARYLVFGGSGHIGGPAAATLAARAGPASVRIATSRAAALAPLRAGFPGSEIVLADMLDAAAVARAIEGIAAIFIVNPDFFADRAAVDTVVAATRAAGTRPHIVRVQAEFPDIGIDQLDNKFAQIGPRRGHLEARAAIEASGLPATFLNSLAYYMDDFTRHFAPTLRTGHRLVIPFERPMCFIDPGDLGEAAACVMLAGPDAQAGKLHHLNNGEDGISFRAVAALIAEVTGVPIAYEPDPDVFRAELGSLLNEISGSPDALEYLIEDWRMEQERPHLYVGNTALETLIGRRPRSLRAWLSAHRAELVEIAA